MGGKGHIQVQVVFVKLLRVRGLLIGGQAQLPLDAAAVPTVVPLAVGGLAAEKEGHGQRLFLLAVSHGEGRFAGGLADQRPLSDAHVRHAAIGEIPQRDQPLLTFHGDLAAGFAVFRRGQAVAQRDRAHVRVGVGHGDLQRQQVALQGDRSVDDQIVRQRQRFYCRKIVRLPFRVQIQGRLFLAEVIFQPLDQVFVPQHVQDQLLQLCLNVGGRDAVLGAERAGAVLQLADICASPVALHPDVHPGQAGLQCGGQPFVRRVHRGKQRQHPQKGNGNAVCLERVGQQSIQRCACAALTLLGTGSVELVPLAGPKVGLKTQSRVFPLKAEGIAGGLAVHQPKIQPLLLHGLTVFPGVDVVPLEGKGRVGPVGLHFQRAGKAAARVQLLDQLFRHRVALQAFGQRASAQAQAQRQRAPEAE